MIIRIRFFLAAIFLTFATSALATDEGPPAGNYLMFLGKMEETTIYPKDWDAAEPPESCYYEEKSGQDVCEFTVTNGCGDQAVSFRVILPIFGNFEGDTLTLDTSIGEWCEPVVKPFTGIKFVFVELAYSYYDNAFNVLNVYNSQGERLLKISQVGGEESYFVNIKDPFAINACSRFTRLNCLDYFVPTKPVNIGEAPECVIEVCPQDDERRTYFWFQEYQMLMKMGLITKTENNEVYLIKTLSLEKLQKALQDMNTSK